MPHLRGASPVGHDDGGHSYVARTVDRSRPSRPSRQRRGRGANLCTRAAKTYVARPSRRDAGLHELRPGKAPIGIAWSTRGCNLGSHS